MKTEEMIKNYDEIADELAEMLKNYALAQNEFQTDVYLYVKKDRTAELDEYTNAGGNSWLNDDHITIYSDMSHSGGEPIDYAGILDMTNEELEDKVREFHGMEAEEDVTLSEIKEYLEENPELEFEKKFEELVIETGDFQQQAMEILDNEDVAKEVAEKMEQFSKDNQNTYGKG